MAVTNEQKIDFLLKKIGYTKTKTGSVVGTGAISGTPKQPFAEAIPSPLIIANGALWNEADSIPATPPGADTTQVKVYLAATSGLRMTADATSSGQRAYIAYSTYNNTSSTRLTNWIDTQFGASYIIKVYRGDPNSGGVNLSAAGSGNNDGWFFDYSAGVLNFNDTNVPSGVTDTNIYIVGYRYIGQTGAPTSGISTFSYLDLTVERNLDVGVQGGISTFHNNIDLNADLDVDGHTNLDNVSIAGVSTFAGAIDLNADLDVDGHTNLDNVSIAGVTTTSGHIYIDADNKRLFVGADSDISIYNDGSNSRITNQNGQLIVSSPIFTVQTGNYNQIISREAAEVDLYYKGVKKFSTASSGINVVGTTTSTQLAITGVSTFTGNIDANGDLDVDGHTNLDNISVAGVSTFTGDATFSGNVSIGGTLTYEDVTNVDSVGLLTARSGIRVTGGVIEALAGENKIPSLYAAMGNLPSAGSYHGMFAHVHATGRGYFAHAGNWYELVNKEVNGVVGTGTERYNIGPVDLTTLDVSGISTFAGNIDINADIDVDGHTNLDNVSVAGVTTFAGAIDANGDLDVDGHTNLDNVSIAGVTTANGNITISNEAPRLKFHDTNHNPDFDLLAESGKLFFQNTTNPSNAVIIDLATKLATFGGGVDVDDFVDVGSNIQLGNAGVITATTFKGDGDFVELDVDGHTNLDNVSITGITTFFATGTTTRFLTNIDAQGDIDLNGDLDVDGHTNLDNVNIAGVTTTTEHIDIDADNKAIRIGDSQDIQIFHNTVVGGGRFANSSYIENNTGNLFIRGTLATIIGSTSGEIYAQFLKDEKCELRFDNNVKFVTTNTGVTVTGTIVADGADINGDIDVDGHTNLDNLSVSGVSTFAGSIDANGDLDVDGHTNLDNVSVAGVTTFASTAEFDGTAKFDSTITAGGATGTNGQYLKTTGTGVEWATFPSLRTRQTFTASAGQTTFSFNYTVNFLDVFVNGVKLTDSEFTATNGTSVVLAVGSFVGDIVELVSYNTVSAGGGASGISNLVEDTSPQLGGNLDLFNKSITGTGNVNITGIISATTFKGPSGVTATFIGDGSGLTGITASGSGVIVKDSGSTVGTAGTINFGTNLSVSPASAGIVTVTAGVTTSQFNVNKLDVSGISTFKGNIDVNADVVIDGNIDLNGDIDVDGHTNLDNVSVAGITTFTDNIHIKQDDKKILFGDNDELEIFHGADGSFISHTNSIQKLFINTSSSAGIEINKGVTENIAKFIPDGAVELYYNNTKRFETTAQGIEVTGHSELDNVNIAGVVTATTFKGAVQATSGTFSSGVDITGDLDVDGHTDLDNVSVAGVVTATTFVGALTGNVTGNVSGSSGSTTGNAATATALQNARTIGGVSFDGTANINLPGVNSAGNQNTSGNAATATLATDATSFTVSANNSTNETVYPVFVDGATGSQGAETDTGLTYNPSTGNLTSTKFTGDGSGLTGITASGSGVVIKHDGSTVGTAGTINFGTNLDVSALSGGSVTITASGGSGSGISTISGVVNIVDDLDVDGHTNLDNVSIVGVATVTGSNINIEGGSASLSQLKINSTGRFRGVQLDENGTRKAHFQHDATNNKTIVGTAEGTLQFNSGDTGRIILNSSGHWVPVLDSTYDLGLTGTRWRNVYADTLYGDGSNLTGVNANVGITTNLSGSFTASAGSPSTINTFGYGSGDIVVEYTVFIKNGSDFQSQKLLAMRDGTTIHSTQFAVMYSSSLLVQLDATISSGNILLRATPETGVSGSTTYKVKREVM